MASSLNILSEEIIRIYRRGIDRENTSPLDAREVKLKVAKAINQLIKAEHLSRGDVQGTVVGTYDLTREGTDPYFITLPANPISLPKDQGVHRVYPQNCPWKAYIPMMNGDFDLIKGTFTEMIEGQIAYFLEGRKIVFTDSPANEITVKLVVYDPETLDGNDILPISADMEGDVIQMVLQMYGMGQISQYEMNSKHEQSIENPRYKGN